MRLKIYFVSIVAAIMLIGCSDSYSVGYSQKTIIEKLQSLPKVSDVHRLQNLLFADKYQFYVEQPLDHKNPAAGTFKQRVFLIHSSFECPTVFVTEGYGAQYAANPFYTEEISLSLNTNLIFVEHRYFGGSVPENADWKYLTAENSANDHHRIREIFKEFYKGKWIATGISKGGVAALIYRTFFPEDVDITVSYVAPLNREKEDSRHEIFLSEVVGTAEERLIIENFQKEVLSRRDELQPKFDSLCTANMYTFNLPTEEIFDYCVLEFSFAFWQWGNTISELPNAGSSAHTIFNYFTRIISPSYFMEETSYKPFFVQAGRELGYYGYATEPFTGLLKIEGAEGYLDKIFIPKAGRFEFDNRLYEKVRNFVATTDKKMLFIYGEFDPWSAAMVEDPQNSNIVILTQPGGNHRTRILTLPYEMRERAVSLIGKWLQE